MKTAALLGVLLCGLASLAAAPSTISTTEKFAYAANAGWIDFRSSAADGVVVSESFLSGKAYAANFGWIDLGDGSPDNGHTYSNTSAGDCGVNLSSTGALSGYAYSANIGWINFEQSHGLPHLDFQTGTFTGYAYAANLGWIALNTASSALVTTTLSYPDSDGDGIGDSYEKRYFGNLEVADASSDFDGDGATDLQEYAANTDPKDPSSLLRITQHEYYNSHSIVTLTFTSSSNRLYTIEHDADLVGTWADSGLALFAPDPGATSARTFRFDHGPRRFFRVLAHLPLQP
ncbi:MAG: thrombospondin type 3 repeat-containing protein [Verrucomicrobia bacterium]|nr:thrombospondin type 3 repeat-containing protein [Verrucomicrobiota bacterium]